MFLFTTTTVINDLKDFTTGKDLIEASADGKVIRIKRHNPFVKENISCVYKAVAEAAVCDVATIPGLAEAEKDMRVQLYIRSIGNADPMYANSLVFKGKPMNIEVPAGTTKDKLVEIANKYLNLVFGGEAQLVASLSDSDLVLTCVNPFQRITKVTVAERAIEKNYGHGAMVAEFGDGVDKTAECVTVGTEGFGDYDHLLKDLRLPTGANLRWKRTMEDEMPVPGVMYNQYTLYYTVDRGVMGLHAVGAKATSQTTHVFWVNQKHAGEFEAFFEGKIEKVNKRAAASEENTEAGA